MFYRGGNDNMAKKVRDYAKLAADIKEAIGESNILTATHCATRLRLVLKETPDESVTKKIEQMPGVIQIIQAGGQYQIVIGTHAKDVYEHLSGMMTFAQDAPEIKESLLNRVIAMMSGCIAPFVYVLAAAGLLQGLLIIIRLFVDISATGANQLYDMISWTPFTFLPVFIAVAGSRHFKCNPYIALWCCLALTNPTWASIAASISEGTPLKFFFIPLTSVTYTSTVIPPILLVAVLSWVEKKVENMLPDTFKAIGTPFLCTVIMVPLTIVVIGPVSTLLANGLAAAYNTLYAFLPWLASAILGGVWQVLVVFGVHWSFTPLSIANYANIGFDQMQPLHGHRSLCPDSCLLRRIPEVQKLRDQERSGLFRGHRSLRYHRACHLWCHSSIQEAFYLRLYRRCYRLHRSILLQRPLLCLCRSYRLPVHPQLDLQ